MRGARRMRGAPQSGLARLMSRINLRISGGTPGLQPLLAWISNARTIEKPSPMPTNQGLRPDDGQCVYNARNEAIQPHEHQSVESAENKFLRGIAPQHIDLLPENQDFRLKPRPQSEVCSWSVQPTAV